MPHKILSPAAICLPCQREVAAPPARPEGLPRPQMPPAETPHFVGADSISARGRPHRRKVCGTMQASSPTEVCYNAWPRPSRSAQNTKFIRRGGIYPAREPRAAIGTPGFAPRLKYTPNRPPCQRGLAAGKARRLGDCPPANYRPRGPAQPGVAPRQTAAPGGAPPKRAPFRQRHFTAKQSLRPRFARPPPFDKGG